MLIELAAMVATGMAGGSVQDCRAIADPAARLSCYDAREREPGAAAAATAPVRAAPARKAPVAAAAAPPVRAATTESVRSDRTGRIVAVAPLRYGYHRVTLDDGRAFDTATNTAAPPVVGADVTLRRSLIGTTFLDIKGRDPITVRPVRPRG